MKLLYISVHETLEHDELQLFSELGIECFSLGAYTQPEGHFSLKRPGIKGMKFDKKLAEWSVTFPKTNIPKEFIEQFDVVLVMHEPHILVENWNKFKGKKVVFRSIGQSTEYVENMIRPLRYDGLKIVRMSPKEEQIIGYVGHDAVIRFYKDPEEWGHWTGETKRVINITQSLKGRRVFCHYDSIMQILNGFPTLIYGSGNEDLGGLNGGELPYEFMKGTLRDSRCFVYGGTWPSPYTLSFIEALMSGIPIVAIGQKLAEELPEIGVRDRFHYYEIEDIIQNGDNGYISDTINDLRKNVQDLLDDHNLAIKIADRGRKTAIKLFGKEQIKQSWKDFFDKI